MKLPDGREAICTLELPLALDVVGAIGAGIADALEALGYTDLFLLTDGSNRVVATPPVPEP